MFVSVRTNQGTAPAFSTERSFLDTIGEKVGTLFQTFSELTTLCWYGMQYAADALLYTSAQKNFSESETLVKTTNHAKFTELGKYVKPTITFSEEAITSFKLHGFTLSQKFLAPRPFDEGKCLGGVLFFLTQWLLTQNIEKVAKEFIGGIPYEGALYQEAYDSCEAICHRKIVDWLNDFIDAALKKENHRARKIMQEWASSKEYKGALLILQAVGTFLMEGGDPSKGGMLEAVKKTCEKRGQKLSGTLYASVREVADHYEKKGMPETERIDVLLSFLGAKILPTKELLHGAYILRFPVPTIQSHHTVGLINLNDRTVYFYDPNDAIAKISKTDLTQKIEHLISSYKSPTFSLYKLYLTNASQKKNC